MTDTKNIYQRILAVMAEVDYIQKGDKKAGGMYRYVSHDQVTEALHPQLVKHGIVVIPTVESMTQDGNRTAVCLSVDFINADKPEDRIAILSWGYGVDTSDKGPGKAVSYAFKYAMLKTFMLETGDDPDHDQDTKYEPKKDLIDTNQVMALEEMNIEQVSEFTTKVLNYYKINSYSELDKSQFAVVYPKLKAEYEKVKK